MKTEEGKTLADSLGIKFLETSAKDAVNVEKAFTTLSTEIKAKVQSRPGGGKKVDTPTTVIKPIGRDQKDKKQGCC